MEMFFHIVRPLTGTYLIILFSIKQIKHNTSLMTKYSKFEPYSTYRYGTLTISKDHRNGRLQNGKMKGGSSLRLLNGAAVCHLRFSMQL